MFLQFYFLWFLCLWWHIWTTQVWSFQDWHLICQTLDELKCGPTGMVSLNVKLVTKLAPMQNRWSDDEVMMKWWWSDDEVMMKWWWSDDEVMMKWWWSHMKYVELMNVIVPAVPVLKLWMLWCYVAATCVFLTSTLQSLISRLGSALSAEWLSGRFPQADN